MIYYGKSAVQAGGVFAKAVTPARKPRGYSNTSTSSSSAIRYTYNAAGDVVYDQDKGLTYSYNALGLVSQVLRADGTGLQYRYAADGTLVTSTETQAAAGGGVAVSSRMFNLAGDRHDAMSGETYVHTPFGATLLDAGLSAKHVGFHADHLGNIILAYSDLNSDGFVDPSTEILEENRYYPYGLKLPVYTRQSTALPFAYNGAEEQNSFGLHLTTYRTMAPEVAFWGQVDPKAELMYGYSPYSAMAGNPISFNDPDGDVIPVLVFVGAAVIGGGMNLYSNWSSVTKNPWSAVGYFASGAAGGAVSVVNPVLGGSIAAGGNVITDAASGNLPDFSHWTDVAGYAGGVALDAVSVGGSGKIAKMGYNGLKGFGKDLAKDIITDQALAFELGSELGYEFARDAGGQIIWDGAAGALLTQVSGQATVVGQAINHAPGALAGLGAFGANVQLGAQNGWDINGPRSTAKWQGPGGQTYTKFGSDGTVWSKNWSNHGGGKL